MIRKTQQVRSRSFHTGDMKNTPTTPEDMRLALALMLSGRPSSNETVRIVKALEFLREIPKGSGLGADN